MSRPKSSPSPLGVHETYDSCTGATCVDDSERVPFLQVVTAVSGGSMPTANPSKGLTRRHDASEMNPFAKCTIAIGSLTKNWWRDVVSRSLTIRRRPDPSHQSSDLEFDGQKFRIFDCLPQKVRLGRRPVRRCGEYKNTGRPEADKGRFALRNRFGVPSPSGGDKVPKKFGIDGPEARTRIALRVFFVRAAGCCRFSALLAESGPHCEIAESASSTVKTGYPSRRDRMGRSRSDLGSRIE